MIWPLKSKPKEEYKPPSFQGIKFGSLKYIPKSDITPHEVSLMLPLFVTMFRFNRKEYIEKHQLQRHFEESTE